MNDFSFECSVFVEKRRQCGVVRVDKVIEISRMVSDEPRDDTMKLELRYIDGFAAPKENVYTTEEEAEVK